MSGRPGVHLPSLLQLIISGAGFIFSLSAFSLFLFLGLVSLASGNFANPELRILSTLAWISILGALLLLPSLVLAFSRLLNLKSKWLHATTDPAVHHDRRAGMKLAGGLMLLFPLLILAGEYISRLDILAWLVMPPLSLLAIIIPLWWIYQVGSRGLKRGSAQQQWGLVSVGLVVTPWLIILAEMILVLIAGWTVFLSLVSHQGFLDDLNRLNLIWVESQLDVEQILTIFRPYLQSPMIIIASLVVAAGLIPLLEELLKPLGMLGLMMHKPTPQEGFTAGLICGGTFALLESLGMMSSFSGEGWAVLAVGRMGTGLLHSVTTALTGWGLAVAWGKRQYLQLALIYLIAAFLHGLWNAFSLAMAVEPLLLTGGGGNPILAGLPSISHLILLVVIILLLALLVGCNRMLRRQKDLAIPD